MSLSFLRKCGKHLDLSGNAQLRIYESLMFASKLAETRRGPRTPSEVLLDRTVQQIHPRNLGDSPGRKSPGTCKRAT